MTVQGEVEIEFSVQHEYLTPENVRLDRPCKARLGEEVVSLRPVDVREYGKDAHFGLPDANMYGVIIENDSGDTQFLAEGECLHRRYIKNISDKVYFYAIESSSPIVALKRLRWIPSHTEKVPFQCEAEVAN